MFTWSCSGDAPVNVDPNVSPEPTPHFDHITDPKAALAEGDRLFDSNETEFAIEAYRQAVKLDPDLAEAHFKLGVAYALIESEMEQSGVQSDEPDNSNDKKGSSPKPRSQRSFENAVVAYKKWLDGNPKDGAAYYNLGRAYNKLNKDEEAEDAFRQAVKINPDDTEYQMELGAILIKLANYREAIAPLQKAIELDPENSRAIDLLDDAEAGRKRVDFNQPPANDSKGSSNTNANPANTNVAPEPKATNTNAATKSANTATKMPERPRLASNKD